jgi:hypothetical protein
MNANEIYAARTSLKNDLKKETNTSIAQRPIILPILLPARPSPVLLPLPMMASNQPLTKASAFSSSEAGPLFNPSTKSFNSKVARPMDLRTSSSKSSNAFARV